MLDENALPFKESDKSSGNINTEIERLSFKYFKENYTSTIDFKDFDTIVDVILAHLDCEVEKSEIEKLVSDWMRIVISLRGKDIVVVEDNLRDFNDIKAAINELGFNVYKKEHYRSINDFNSEIDNIIRSDANPTLNVVITDIFDNSDEVEYFPQKPLRCLQYLPSPTKTELEMIGTWIDIAKNNLIVIADVAKKLGKHMLIVTKISREILGKIINVIYDQENIKYMFEANDSGRVISRIRNAGLSVLYKTKNITLVSKPYYDDDDDNASEDMVKEIMDDYDAEINRFKTVLKDKLLDILIKG